MVRAALGKAWPGHDRRPRHVVLAHDALVDSDGWPTDGLRELVDNVVAHQRGTAASAAVDIMEFMDFESGVRASAARPSPYGVIPPYLFIGGKDSGRLDANTGAVRLAIEQKKGGGETGSSYPSCWTEASCWTAARRPALWTPTTLTAWASSVWIAHMDEKSADRGTLESFRGLAKGLARRGRPVTGMYGGLFMLRQGPRGCTARHGALHLLRRAQDSVRRRRTGRHRHVLPGACAHENSVLRQRRCRVGAGLGPVQMRLLRGDARGITPGPAV